MPKTIDPEIRSLLSSMTCEGDLVARCKIDLDRPTYTKLNKVLEALGAKWNRSRKGHVFANGADAADMLADALTTGLYADNKVDFQQFFTPVELAKDVVKLADIKPGMVCLEPSAGSGRIAQVMADHGGAVDCIEIDPKLVNELRKFNGYAAVQQADFLTIQPATKSDRLYDRIVMNGPFCKSQDVKHVRHAFNFLKPGGKLVAIMSPGINFRTDGQYKAFNEFIGGPNVEEYQVNPNPEGAFKAEGTMVKTVTVQLRKAA